MRDPYLYDDCDVLKNKLGLKNQDVLDKAEAEFAGAALREIVENPISGNFDFSHLCELHKKIFNDVYEWAGSPRTIPMEKPESHLGYASIIYSKPEEIKKDAGTVLDKMKAIQWDKLTISEQAKELSSCLSDLWKVHPFREGNTRTTITFMCQFAESRGLSIDRNLFAHHAAYTRDALVAANSVFPDGDFRKPEYIIKIVQDSLERGVMARSIESEQKGGKAKAASPERRKEQTKKIPSERTARSRKRCGFTAGKQAACTGKK